MVSPKEDIQTVCAMKHGDTCWVAEFGDGGGEVYRINDIFLLFEVPQFGGAPRYSGTYRQHEIAKLVASAHSWT